MRGAIRAVLVGALLLGCGGRSVDRGSARAGAAGGSGESGAPSTAGAAGEVSAGGDAGGAAGGDANAGAGQSGAGTSSGGSWAFIPVIKTSGPTAIGVDDQFLYWLSTRTGASTVSRCRKADGSDSVTLYELDTNDADTLELSQDAVWTRSGDGGIVACAKSGCDGAPRVVLQGASAESGPGDVGGTLGVWATNGAELAWANGKQIRVCQTDQCTSEHSQTLLALDHGHISALKIHGGQLYGIWASATLVPDARPVSQLFSIPLADPAPPTVLAESLGEGPLALDDEHVFWIDAGKPEGSNSNLNFHWFGGSILMTALDGSSETSVLARYDDWQRSVAIAADSAEVYWTVGEDEGSYGYIVRARAGADDSAAELSLLSQGTTSGMALDADYVYWSDANSRAIVKHAR